MKETSWPTNLVGPICTKIGKVVGVHDDIIQSNFGFKILSGFRSTGGQNFLFPYWLCWSSLQQCWRYRAACDCCNVMQAAAKYMYSAAVRHGMAHSCLPAIRSDTHKVSLSATSFRVATTSVYRLHSLTLIFTTRQKKPASPSSQYDAPAPLLE